MTDIAVREDQPQRDLSTLDTEQLKVIASTDFVPKSLRGNLPAILACVAMGRAIGIPDMQALRQIHIVDGKPTMSAELMVSLVRKRGHSITGTVGSGIATVAGRRRDNGDTMETAYTLEMAQRAGLAGKDNWKKYPEAMLWARAVSQLCRMLFADVLGGLAYTPDEAEMTDEDHVREAVADLRPPTDSGPDDRITPDGQHTPAATGPAAPSPPAGPNVEGHNDDGYEAVEGEIVDDRDTPLFQPPLSVRGRKPNPETGE
jgi:hypothetical protein